MLVVNLAEKNKAPLKLKSFFKIGFPTTIFQLFIVTLFFSFIYQPLVGFLLLLIVLGMFAVIGMIYMRKNKITFQELKHRIQNKKTDIPTKKGK
jgi:ABC-type iron transport system FetAB permease component